MKPRVWNAAHRNAPHGAVYCGRGSLYGNPFRIGDRWRGKLMTRADVCDRFEAEVLPTLNVEPLRGKDLICHCKPLRCHCDPILRKANA